MAVDGSLTLAQSRALARAQRVTMAAITGRWHPSHSQQIEELSLEPLDTRRTRLCHRFAERTATQSRHTSMFTLAGAGVTVMTRSRERRF